MDKKWKKLLLLTLCKLPLQERQEALEEVGFTLPEILEEISSSFATMWLNKDENETKDLSQLRLPIGKWLAKSNSTIKDHVLEAFRVMKIRYVFQIYGYSSINKESFSLAFRRNFSKEYADAAEKLLESLQEKTKIPLFSEIEFTTDATFWLQKTWGM